MRGAVLGLLTVWLVSCTNVDQMQKRYEAGDEKQLQRLAEIAGGVGYPYATRRKAARALGEIGDPRAVPVLTRLLYGVDQRITLKEEALGALAKIGDRRAVPAIGRMLDFETNEANGELRTHAIDALGRLGGADAAEILVNALRYYDVVLLRHEQRTRRGIFSGEELPDPYGAGYGTASPDSSRSSMPTGPRVGVFGRDRSRRPVGMFGTPLPVAVDRTQYLRREQESARAALVSVGPEAVPVIRRFLEENDTTRSLRRQLEQISAEIQHPAASPDSAVVAPALPDSGG